MTKRWLVYGLVLVALIASSLLYAIHQDEGVYLTIGKAINQGAVPYRDLFDQKPPGIYLIISLMVRAFGPNWWWVRATILLVNCLSAYLVYLIGRRLAKASLAILTAFLYLSLVPLFHGQFMLTEPWVALWGLAAVYLLETNFFYAGLAAGLAVWFKQSGIVFLAVGLGRLILETKKAVNFLGGFLTAAGLLALYLVTSGIGQEFWSAAVLYYRYNYPPISWVGNWPALISLGPLLIMTVLSGLAIWTNKRRQTPLVFTLLGVIVLSMPFLIYRPYYHYWVQVLPFVTILYILPLKIWPSLTKVTLAGMIFISGWVLAYSILIQYPQRLKQQPLAQTSDCHHNSHPVTYYLTDCVPDYGFTLNQ
jgi:hypothetical protein